MNNPKAAFRNAMGGYHKQDVNDYIVVLCDQYENQIKSREAHIASLGEQLETLRARSGGEGELEGIKNELEQANHLVSAQTERINALTTQLEELRGELNRKTAELADAQEKLSRFTDAAEKLHNYDLMSAKVGELLVEAASSAEKIKQDAAQQADAILKQSKAQAEEHERMRQERVQKLEADYTAAVHAMNASLTRMAQEGMASLSAALGSAQDEINAVTARRSLSVQTVIQQVSEKLPELEKLAAIKLETETTGIPADSESAAEFDDADLSADTMTPPEADIASHNNDELTDGGDSTDEGDFTHMGDLPNDAGASGQ